RPRPLRHRLLALHVLRDLRRGVSLRRPVLEPRVRVLRVPARRPAPRQGAPGRVDAHRPGQRGLRGRVGAESEEDPPMIATLLLAADLNVAQNIAFAIIAVVIIAAALRVVTTNNVVHAALYLVLVLAGVGGLYFILGAEFVGTT